MKIASKQPLDSYLYIVSAVLLLVNLLVVYFFDHEIGRIFRLLASGTTLFLLFRLPNLPNARLKRILMVLVASDVIMLFYDDHYGAKGYLVVSGICYAMMAFLKVNRIKWKEIGVVFLSIYALIAAFNVYTLFYVVEEIKYLFHDSFHTLLVKAYGIAAILFCFLIGSWHSAKGTFSSAYYLYAIFGFVLSDILYALGMYYDIPFFYYIERIIYLAGLFFIYKHAVISREEVMNNVTE